MYRTRRGISQVVLAGLVGRSESWLSQVERGVRDVDRVSVLLEMAKVLRVELAELVGLPFALRPAGGSHEYVKAAAIRAALTDIRPSNGTGSDGTLDLGGLAVAVREFQATYQAARYVAAGEMVTGLAHRAQDAVSSARRGEDRQRALRLRPEVYTSTAALLSRVGEAGLSWVAADRAVLVAQHAGDPELVALGVYRLAQALLRAGEVADAYRVATAAADDLAAAESAGAVSLRGALLLTAALAAARGGDSRENLALLRRAAELAEVLGEDRNDYFTAFGPTNVALHVVSSAVELGDAADVIRQAERVDLTRLPVGLAGRRSQVHMDLAWAYGQQRNDPAAVFSLIEAERIAPEVLRYDPATRDLLWSCLRRERRTAVPGLRPLAQRVGIIG
jgi:transcriptional regulator with XRE-family HTH domain